MSPELEKVNALGVYLQDRRSALCASLRLKDCLNVIDEQVQKAISHA